MQVGNRHDYLGVDLGFKQDGRLKVSMVNYLKGVIEGFLEQIVGRAATPAGERLFDIRDKKEAKPLEEERAITFHHTTVQLLFMAAQARRDILTAVTFLTTRVKSPDEGNWGKLKRVLKYLNGTKYLKLSISVENLGILKLYVDGSHNVHWDCKGHGGVILTMGKGSVSSYLRKVKLNTRSSTEAEFVVADMYMLLPICVQFCYANGDSPYAKFLAFLPVRIQGVPICVRGPDSDVSAIFSLSHAFLRKTNKPRDNLFVSPTRKKRERDNTKPLMSPTMASTATCGPSAPVPINNAH